ncbi:MAG: hypothetical protein M3Z04_01365 [Chloroflexota bacterium]|nr:hypothetical protein [Chloroflexota bacterium]
MSKATAEIIDIEQDYAVPQPDAVRAFLDGYPFLIPLLAEAHTAIQQHFPQSRTSLELLRDPEALEVVELVAAIDPGCAPTAALDQYESFKQAWWLDAMARTQGQLTIAVLYQ